MPVIMNNHVFKGHKTLLGNRYVTYAELELSNRYEIFDSFDGFDWGNTSKASLQLGFAILYQSSDKDTALRYNKKFTEDVVSKLSSRDWILSRADVLKWIEKNCDKPVMKKLQPITRTKKKNKNNVVKKVCKELNITQKELAKILEIPEGTVSSWAVKNEIPRLGKKAIEFYILSIKNQKIIESYRSFRELLEAS
jgi:DNA-binding transcriptional regulator YiaG